MNMNEFLKHVEEQFQDTPLGTLNKDTHFKDVPEWSSLVALCIIAMVDENYQKTLTGDDLKNSTTIEDIFNTVAKK